MSLVLCMKLAGRIGSADRPKGMTSAYQDGLSLSRHGFLISVHSRKCDA
jgi:hypothetical protein